MTVTRLVRAAAMLIMAGGAAPSFAQAPSEGRKEQGNVVIHACVGKQGELLSAKVARSSGVASIDAAALEVARNTVYAPAKNANGKPKRKSCLNFMVKFVLEDGKPVPST